MGRSRWDDAQSYAMYSTATTTRASMSSHELQQKVFTTRHLREDMDPSKIIIRESRDSDANPESTAIIIGLDVTGSMGIIAEKLARGKLGDLMDAIYKQKPVTDPHVMVMGIGDVNCDSAPLQVSQFEADIKIDESLQGLYLEGGGGGNRFESYDLPWFFAAARTSIDCVEKRNKKGYLFTIGDEMPPLSDVTKYQLNEVFGKTEDVPMTPSAALAAAREKYDVFHIIVKQGNYCSYSNHFKEVVGAWTELLGRRAIVLTNWEHVDAVIIAAIQLNEGVDLDSVLAAQNSDAVRKTLLDAFGE